MSFSIWQQPEIIRWSQILTRNFKQLLNKDLVASANTPEQLAQTLFDAPFVVVSHGTQADPILNYGNQMALQLWSISWDEFVTTPSRLTAEPVNRSVRAQMLEQAAKQGYIDNYQGIRISRTGQRFLIEQAIIWNLTDEFGKKCGQAATFSDWKLLG
ncbi:MEKHLA domain-containing protein [Pleurocapsa sp. FMAR1]|uniref:MEKHLA domain-containing protein n=1 Tax=Pleurocapsa sp. FMAR1 TaxID=3040204 RepID=UPI0029C6CB16|nr:MEKHLA domain-containing protein [Pleurocapsa sp. FMAR1]